MRFSAAAWPLLTACCLWAAAAAPALLLPDVPMLTLPWGTWAVTHYDEEAKFYTFKNVRFGKAPVGALRFATPQYPEAIPNANELQDSTYGPACHQVDTSTCDCAPADCPGNGTSSGGFLTAQTIGATSEDCLFLDLYVPEAALAQRNASLPVVVWIHGGGFLFGAKDSHDAGLPLYNGTGVLHAARETGQELIFVAINYRLGAFGWMAGSTFEAGGGTPNVGLYDQRLALQWVQDFIHLVGGDPDRVSAWGESAGGGSILHHLVAEDGTRDPLFRRAVVQSPGFEWQYDRSAGGSVDQAFLGFSEAVGCEDGEMECLRASGEGALAVQNQAAYDAVKCEGKPPFGPAVDGVLIRRLPIVSYRGGKFWKELDSIIVSHVADETSGFVPKFVANETDFQQLVANLFPQPELDLVRELVADRYGGGNARNRSAALLRDAFFTCNTRQLVDAYGHARGRYAMQYNFLAWLGLAVHGADLLALFWNRGFDIGAVITDQYPATPTVIVELVSASFGTYARQYQSYFVSHAVADSPNAAAANLSLPEWSMANDTDAGLLGNVMEAGYSFFGNYFTNSSVDALVARSSCDFWGVMADIIDQKFSGDEAEQTDVDWAFTVQD